MLDGITVLDLAIGGSGRARVAVAVRLRRHGREGRTGAEARRRADRAAVPLVQRAPGHAAHPRRPQGRRRARRVPPARRRGRRRDRELPARRRRRGSASATTTCAAVNPAIVYCSTSGLRADRPARAVGGTRPELPRASEGFLDCYGPRADGGPPVPGATVADSAGGGMHAVDRDPRRARPPRRDR